MLSKLSKVGAFKVKRSLIELIFTSEARRELARVDIGEDAKRSYKSLQGKFVINTISVNF